MEISENSNITLTFFKRSFMRTTEINLTKFDKDQCFVVGLKFVRIKGSSLLQGDGVNILKWTCHTFLCENDKQIMIFCDLAKNLNQIVGIFINLFISLICQKPLLCRAMWLLFLKSVQYLKTKLHDNLFGRLTRFCKIPRRRYIWL